MDNNGSVRSCGEGGTGDGFRAVLIHENVDLPVGKSASCVGFLDQLDTTGLQDVVELNACGLSYG